MTMEWVVWNKNRRWSTQKLADAASETWRPGGACRRTQKFFLKAKSGQRKLQHIEHDVVSVEGGSLEAERCQGTAMALTLDCEPSPSWGNGEAALSWDCVPYLLIHILGRPVVEGSVFLWDGQVALSGFSLGQWCSELFVFAIQGRYKAFITWVSEIFLLFWMVALLTGWLLTVTKGSPSHFYFSYKITLFFFFVWEGWTSPWN